MPAESAKALILDLLSNNGNCQLPCLWGLKPGLTDIRTAKNISEQFGNISTSEINVSVRKFDDGGGITIIYREDSIDINTVFGYTINNDNGKVGMLGLNGFAMLEKGTAMNWLSPEVRPLYGDVSFNKRFENYLLPKILSNYGKPTKVLLAPFLEDPNRSDIKWKPFSLVLYYPEQGIFVEHVTPRETVGNYYASCPLKTQFSLAVWSPNSNLTLEDIVQKAGLEINQFNIDYFKPIEKATSLTLDEFYQVFKNPTNTSCLETSIALWNP